MRICATVTRNRDDMAWRKYIGVLVLVAVFAAVPVSAARLPAVGNDAGLWGGLLNEFLLVSLTENGSLRADVISDTSLVAEGAITAEDILDGTLTGAEFVPESITSDDLEPNIILTSALIADGAVTGTDILDESITGDDVGIDEITGTHILDGAVSSEDIADESITSEDILDGGIMGVDIDFSQLTGAHIADGTITDDDIADNVITTRTIALGAVTASEIADETIDTTELADDAVASDKIADGTITSFDIADEAVTGLKIADGGIQGVDIDPDADIEVATVQAGTFLLGMAQMAATCDGIGCEATVACDAGKTIIFGFRSTASASCATAPNACESYCTMGDTACTAIADGAGASVYAICALVS